MGERVEWWDDPGDDLDLHPERCGRVRSDEAPGVVDLVAAVFLLATALIASPAAWFAVVISGMAVDACAMPSAGCHPRAASPVVWAHPVATLVVLVLGCSWTVVRRLRRRRGWPAVLATLVGVVVVFLAAVVTIQVASGGHLL